MAGNVPFPANDWHRARRKIAGVMKWPREFADHDLRYWADPKACEGRPRPPFGELAEDWGVSKSTVSLWVREFEGRPGPSANRTPVERESNANRTPVERESNANRTPVERESNDGEGLEQDNHPDAEQESNASRTLNERSSNAGRTGPKGDSRANVSVSVSSTPSLDRECVLSPISEEPPDPATHTPRGPLSRAWVKVWSERHGVEPFICRPRKPEARAAMRATLGEDEALAEAAYRVFWREVDAHRAWKGRGRATLTPDEFAQDVERWADAARVEVARQKPQRLVLVQTSEPVADPDAVAVWSKVCGVLAERIGHQDVYIWFRSATPTRLVDGVVSVVWPNGDYLDWIAEHHSDELRKALEVAGVTIDVQVAETAMEAT